VDQPVGVPVACRTLGVAWVPAGAPRHSPFLCSLSITGTPVALLPRLACSGLWAVPCRGACHRPRVVWRAGARPGVEGRARAPDAHPPAPAAAGGLAAYGPLEP